MADVLFALEQNALTVSYFSFNTLFVFPIILLVGVLIYAFVDQCRAKGSKCQHSLCVRCCFPVVPAAACACSCDSCWNPTRLALRHADRP